MKIIAIFLLGFCFSYIINVFDLISTLFEAKIALKVTKINAQISEWQPTSYNDFNNIELMCDELGYYDDFEEDLD